MSADLYVDGTAPLTGDPQVAAQLASFGGNRFVVATVTVETSDAVSGVQTVDWDMGDGTKLKSVLLPQAASTSVAHAYVRSGSWAGSVAVTDRARNRAVRPFTVTVPSLQPADPSPSPVPAPVAADRNPPQLMVVAARRQRVLARGGVTMQVTCSEACAAAARAALSVHGRRFRLTAKTRALVPWARARVRVKLSAAVRKALRAARNARPSVTITVTATGAAGNRATRQVRVTAT